MEQEAQDLGRRGDLSNHLIQYAPNDLLRVYGGCVIVDISLPPDQETSPVFGTEMKRREDKIPDKCDKWTREYAYS